MWNFHRKTDGVFVGRGGLKTDQIDGKCVIGLAYAVMPDYWNRGFATEITEASLDVGFEHLRFPEIRFVGAAGQSCFATGHGRRWGSGTNEISNSPGCCIDSGGWRRRIGERIMEASDLEEKS